MGMLDKKLLWLYAAAYNATPTPIDLGVASHAGDGAQLRGRISCGGGDMTGTTALVIKTGTTSAGATGTTIATLPMTHTQANAGFNFNIPMDNLLQWVTISLTGVTAGTLITAGLSLDVQSSL